MLWYKCFLFLSEDDDVVSLNAVEAPFNIPQYVFVLVLVLNSKDNFNGNICTDYTTVMKNIPLIDHSRYHVHINCRNMCVEFYFISE
jgi:hypothetical protein